MMVRILRSLGLLLLSTLYLPAQSVPLTEVRLRTEVTNARIRPHENLVVQLIAYGEVDSGNGEKKRVRIGRNGARFSLKSTKAGWLSKPFRYQGSEEEPFHRSQGAGLRDRVLGGVLSDFALQDSALYTAPRNPGTYEIVGELEGKRASITVRVDRRARSRRQPEETSFAAEPTIPDPRRHLAEHYAPLIAQETWFQPQSDYITRFDFDGDWIGDNNWDSTPVGTSQAYVYYAVMETATHWFLVYDIFHPRDYSDKCVAGTCHENDSEGLILTVAKDNSRFGRLLTMETLAHNNVYSYRADDRVRDNVHDIDGKIELYQSRPVVFVESGGHGVYGSDDRHSRYDVKRDRFKSGTGVTYVYKGKAERPLHANVRQVGYQLLPAFEHLWLRGHAHREQHPRLFDEYFPYQPHGNRPQSLYQQISGAFLGRKEASNKARPFWGWSDKRTRDRKILAQGQWGLDPAYAVQQNLKLPEPFSVDYLFNPYLALTGAAPTSSSAASAHTVQTLAGETRPVKTYRADRGGNYDPRSKKGSFDLRLNIDGNVDVFVREDLIDYHVVDGKEPSDLGSEYSQEIPRASFKRFEVKKEDGRGNVLLLEKPSLDNNFTLKLRFSDPKGGSDRYHARVRWEWDRLMETLTTSTHKVASTTPTAQPKKLPTGPTVTADYGLELFSQKNDPRDYDNDREGEFEFRGRVDERVILTLQGDRVFARLIRGNSPKLDWFSFSQPLPQRTLRELKLEVKDGRGDVVLLERPWEGNQYTAVIQIEDSKGGDDRYQLKLKWKR